MSLARESRISNPVPATVPATVPFDVESDPTTWGPEWDAYRWELGAGPDPDESQWAAEAFGDGATDYDVEDLDERPALEASALDAMELGLIPADLAERIARTSIVGLVVDAIVHRGSDPRYCGCEPCVWGRTRRYADEA